MWHAGLAAFVLMGVSCDQAARRQKQREAADELKQSRQTIHDSMKMTDEGMQVDFNAVDQHRAHLESAGEKMGGKLGEALKISAELQGEINELGKKCADASEDFVKAVDWQTLSEKRDYEARRKVLNDYIALNRQALDQFGNYHRRVMVRLDEIGFTGSEREKFDKGFLKNKKETTELVRTIRQCDIDCSEIALGVINRMEKIGDAWSWNAEEELVEFTENADVEWFGAEMDKFQQKGELQLRAQEDFAKMIKGR